jgi:hypothetical protein
MDTETVLRLIKTLENRLTFKDLSDDSDYTQGKRDAFTHVKNYLEFFIESQVNQVENEMNRGE